MSAESLRRFADAPCPDCTTGTPTDERRWFREHCPTCHGTGLDPRFAALRGGSMYDERKYRLRSDVGSVLRAAAACGLFVAEMSETDGQWDVTLLTPVASAAGRKEYDGFADTPEAALISAFVAAVPEPAS